MGRRNCRSSQRFSVEVDQSGKIERTQVDTILGYANGEQYAIRIPASVKRTILGELRRARRPDKSKKAIPLKLFAVGLYLLLEDCLPCLDRIIIDTEYTGQEPTILGFLLPLIRQRFPGFPSEAIVFQPVGKKSPAHDIAWSVNRGERPANRIVREEELRQWL